MAEGALDHEQVAGAGVEVGREGVAQGMGRELLVDARLPEPVGDAVGDLALAEAVYSKGNDHIIDAYRQAGTPCAARCWRGNRGAWTKCARRPSAPAGVDGAGVRVNALATRARQC
jgi:hypothetical protein